MKKYQVILLLLLLLSLLAPSVPLAGARYSYEGISFEPAAQGTLRGHVYIGGGHGLGFSPYTETFEIPQGNVRWARFYIGVWGGNEKHEGWILPKFNGQELEKLSLAGTEDKNEEVYCAGHGVYWVAYDVSALVNSGENQAEVLTSSGEPGNRLDGRIYGTVLAAVCEDQKAPEISYRLASGNLNLHGKGWGENEGTVRDSADIDLNFSRETGNIKAAELSVVYLTGSKGLPDYLKFNGETLGSTPPYLKVEGEQEKVTDIANEISCDACGNEGSPSGYFDLEQFDVTDQAGACNRVTFLRGLDLDKDGQIGAQEGEDYLHPVFLALVLTPEKTGSLQPDLQPEFEIKEELVEGRETKIGFMVNNPGRACEARYNVSLKVDGKEVGSKPARMDAGGVYRSAFAWIATPGDHTLNITLDPEARIKESDENNNFRTLKIHVKSGPEVSVSLGEPVKLDAEKEKEMEKAGVSAAFLTLLLGLGGRKKKSRVLLGLLLLMCVVLSGCVGQDSSNEADELAYMVPVTITNSGEAAAQNVDLNLYLDGESVTVLKIPKLEGGVSIEEKMRVEINRGQHTLRVEVDELNRITESDEENNECEKVFDFV